MSLDRRVVGIIANPLSGKDIRRVVAQATVFPNHEKVNILRRVLLGMAAVGVDEVLAMPDSAGLIERARDGLELPFPVRQVELSVTATAEDSTRAAALMREAGARCLVTLGGDGTCRAVARGAGQVPLLPLSTGTNNAFPFFVEGTLAGMAAASAAASRDQQMLARLPALQLLRSEEPVDLALVDVAVLSGGLGARAVWEYERISLVVTTRLHPGTVGLSAIGGAVGADAPESAAAVAVTLGGDRRQILAPVAPGVIRRLPVADIRWLADGELIDLPSSSALALDGEREYLTRSERWSVRPIAGGPYVVLVDRAIQALYRRERVYG
ncbi:MAG: ATP-NAD kinase [Herpetosiphonaceae bacterium]|nr:MAG: ATP-NAD kinase [Herpetosiphonaceae bacterium]